MELSENDKKRIQAYLANVDIEMVRKNAISPEAWLVRKHTKKAEFYKNAERKNNYVQKQTLSFA